jgi:uncharacterized protein YprB with RNaseH-like and TPR domain
MQLSIKFFTIITALVIIVFYGTTAFDVPFTRTFARTFAPTPLRASHFDDVMQT